MRPAGGRRLGDAEYLCRAAAQAQHARPVRPGGFLDTAATGVRGLAGTGWLEVPLRGRVIGRRGRGGTGRVQDVFGGHCQRRRPHHGGGIGVGDPLVRVGHRHVQIQRGPGEQLRHPRGVGVRAAPGPLAQCGHLAGDAPLILLVAAVLKHVEGGLLPGPLGPVVTDEPLVNELRLHPVVLVVVPQPHEPRRVGAVADLPAPALSGDAGVPVLVLLQGLAVVGAVADPDALVGHLQVVERQQLAVLVRGEHQRHMALGGHQRGVHAVRADRQSGQERTAQTVMRLLLPVQSDPLIEQVLQLVQAPQRPVGDVFAAPLQIGAGVAGDVLREPAFDRVEAALDDGLVGGGALLAGRTLISSIRHTSSKCSLLKILPWSTTTIRGRITGRAAAPAIRGSHTTRSAYGISDCSASARGDQPGRAGIGARAWASMSTASKERVARPPSRRPRGPRPRTLGTIIAPMMVREATSIAAVSSTCTGRPSSPIAMTSRPVESICTCSPSRCAQVGV